MVRVDRACAVAAVFAQEHASRSVLVVIRDRVPLFSCVDLVARPCDDPWLARSLRGPCGLLRSVRLVCGVPIPSAFSLQPSALVAYSFSLGRP